MVVVLAGSGLRLRGSLGVQRVERLGEKRGDGPRDRATEDGSAEKFAPGSEKQFVHRSGKLKFRSAHDEPECVQDIDIVEFAL